MSNKLYSIADDAIVLLSSDDEDVTFRKRPSGEKGDTIDLCVTSPSFAKRRRKLEKSVDLSRDDSPDVICITDVEGNSSEDIVSLVDCDILSRNTPLNSMDPSTTKYQSIPKPQNVIDYILDIIPDCDEKFAKTCCRKYGVDACAYIDLKVDTISHVHVQNVINYMLENGYEKSKEKKWSVSHIKDREYFFANLNAAAAMCANQKQYLQDYNSLSWEPDEAYKASVSHVLMNLFPYLSGHCVRWLLFAQKQHYAPCVQKICDILVEGAKKDIDNSGQIISDGPEFSSQVISDALSRKPFSRNQITLLKAAVANWTNSKLSVVLKAPRHPIPLVVSSVELKEEMEFVDEKLNEVRSIAAYREDRLRARNVSKVNNTLQECGCCCHEFASMEMTRCTYGHEFCIDCLRKYAEEQIFGLNRTILVCMSVGNECSGIFGQSELERTLSKRALMKWNEACFQQALEAAGLTNIAKCPKCEFQAELPETEMLFCCPAKGCGYKSCRKCGEEAHVPLKCSEVEKKSETRSRNAIEEAMTAALKRECPKCKKSFYKTEGCNKMTCPCGTLSCYLCRQAINDYRHFCQKFECNHSSCGKCRLFSDTVKLDRLAVREAGLKAAKDIPSDGTEVTNEQLQRLIQDSPKKSSPKKVKTADVPRRQSVKPGHQRANVDDRVNQREIVQNMIDNRRAQTHNQMLRRVDV